MTASDIGAVMRALRTLGPHECRVVDTGHGYGRTVYGAGRGRGLWWVVRGDDTGPRWTGLEETLAELTRYATEAAWEASIPSGSPLFD